MSMQKHLKTTNPYWANDSCSDFFAELYIWYTAYLKGKRILIMIYANRIQKSLLFNDSLR